VLPRKRPKEARDRALVSSSAFSVNSDRHLWLRARVFHGHLKFQRRRRRSPSKTACYEHAHTYRSIDVTHTASRSPVSASRKINIALRRDKRSGRARSSRSFLKFQFRTDRYENRGERERDGGGEEERDGRRSDINRAATERIFSWNNSAFQIS